MLSDADIVVVGGGAVGLEVALELQHQGLQTMRDVLVLDAERRPGGTWGRAWDALPLRLAHGLVEPGGLAELGLGLREGDPAALVRQAVPRAFALYEDAVNLYVYRPARVVRVSPRRGSSRLGVEVVAPGGRRTEVVCRVLIDATGTWSSPFVPWVPGMGATSGLHRAAARLERMAELEGRRVLVVGGGRTAVALLRLLEGRAAALAWSTRRVPAFRLAEAGAPGGFAGALRPAFTPSWGLRRDERAPMRAPQRAWIPRTPEIDSAIARGLLRSRGALARFATGGATEALTAHFVDGTAFDADLVVWATGSHASRRHLAPLHVRTHRDGTPAPPGWSRADARVAIVGDGPDATGAEALAHARRIARGAIDALHLR